MQRFGRYLVLGEVARGGMGLVYRARDAQGQEVALKLLIAGRQADPRQRRRFAVEAAALARISHPGLVRLIEAGEAEGVPFLALEWVTGESLAARLAREGPLAPRAAAALVQRLAEALAHCHAQGILHRDLTPHNVLLRAGSDAPLLTDFGLAKDLLRPASPDAPGTLEGHWLGTPAWWPPEQARGRLELIGPGSDVYGLGALLFATLTGRPPQPGNTLLEVLAALEHPPRPPGGLRPGVPAWLDALCVRALDPDPARRPPDAAALAAALARGLDGSGPPAASAARAPRAPVLVAVGLLTAASAFSGGVIWTRQRGQGPAPAPLADPSARLAAELEAVKQQIHAGQVEPALARLDELLRAHPASAHALALRGAARRAANDPRGAQEDYDRAVALDPDLAVARAYRGAWRYASGDVQGALDDLDRALALDPRLAIAWLNRATIRKVRGDLPGALADAERAVGVGDEPLAWVVRAQLRRLTGDPRGAIEDIERAFAQSLRAGDRPRAFEERALSRIELKDDPGALADLDQVVALLPDLASAWHARGNVHLRLGNLDAALADFEQGLRLAPRAAAMWASRGQVHEMRRNPRQALADLEQALKLEPGAPWAAHARAACQRLEAALAAERR